jgi:hypothetical protein
MVVIEHTKDGDEILMCGWGVSWKLTIFFL